MPMAWVARALEIDESRGFMKVLVDGESDQIVGAAILGIDGGEVMSMLQIAMMGRYVDLCCHSCGQVCSAAKGPDPLKPILLISRLTAVYHTQV